MFLKQQRLGSSVFSSDGSGIHSADSNVHLIGLMGIQVCSGPADTSAIDDWPTLPEYHTELFTDSYSSRVTLTVTLYQGVSTRESLVLFLVVALVVALVYSLVYPLSNIR